eukprot:TRINITY_DN9809_c0_g1_i3.p1 TRINITY_DN9809_c0_g1~~TRINITY_DN9809_c0_g1_i3.p1  ORF type:complete len:417 (-),score=98.34 TRINITY_DN9809_c0_g1_i3:310-1560(-)
MQPFIKKVAPKILSTMSDKRESIANASNFLFQLMHTNYGSDVLMPSFIDCLDHSSLIRIKAGALEVMNMLIKESQDFFTSKDNVRLCIKKASQLINDNFKNKKIVLPALGVLLALRDKSYDTAIATILSLPEHQLAKVKALASEYAADLDENIASFEVSQCEPMVKIKKLKPKIKRKESNPENCKASLPRVVHRTPSKVKQGTDLLEEVKAAPARKADRNIMIKVVDKGNSSKTLSAKLMAETEQLNELLILDKTYTEDEVIQILDLLPKVIETKIEKAYWKKMILKALRFLFINAVFVADGDVQMRGLQMLEKLVYHHIELLSPHLNELLESLARAYTLPKKAWEILSCISESVADKFSRREVVPALVEMAVNTEPPLLQAFIRCVTAVVKTGSTCDSFADELVKFLYVVLLACT